MGKMLKKERKQYGLITAASQAVNYMRGTGGKHASPNPPLAWSYPSSSPSPVTALTPRRLYRMDQSSYVAIAILS